jgi:hypothetical protein
LHDTYVKSQFDELHLEEDLPKKLEHFDKNVEVGTGL